MRADVHFTVFVLRDFVMRGHDPVLNCDTFRQDNLSPALSRPQSAAPSAVVPAAHTRPVARKWLIWPTVRPAPGRIRPADMAAVKQVKAADGAVSEAQPWVRRSSAARWLSASCRSARRQTIGQLCDRAAPVGRAARTPPAGHSFQPVADGIGARLSRIDAQIGRDRRQHLVAADLNRRPADHSVTCSWA